MKHKIDSIQNKKAKKNPLLTSALSAPGSGAVSDSEVGDSGAAVFSSGATSSTQKCVKEESNEIMKKEHTSSEVLTSGTYQFQKNNRLS